MDIEKIHLNQWTDYGQAMIRSSSNQNTTNLLDLSPDMIGLLVKAGVSSEKWLENYDYQLNILYKVQKHMNLNPQKYSRKDAYVFNNMKKQLIDDPIIRTYDEQKFGELSFDDQSMNMEMNTLQLDLSSMNLDSDQSYNKYKKFYRERVSSGVYFLHLSFENLSINLYQKAFQLINEVF